MSLGVKSEKGEMISNQNGFVQHKFLSFIHSQIHFLSFPFVRDLFVNVDNVNVKSTLIVYFTVDLLMSPVNYFL